MTQEEKKTHAFSSEQLETVYSMIGSNEPALFSVLQQLSKKYDEKTTIFLTKEFCLNCQSEENQRVGMEFLYMNGFQEELKALININKEHSSQRNKEWGEVYEFIFDRRKNRKFSGELLNLRKFNSDSNDPSLDCLLIFLNIYAHYEKYDYELLKKYKDILTEKLLNIDNTLLRIYFQIRENEVLFHYHWRRNELGIAKTYAHNIIDNTYNQEKRCEILLNLAVVYMFDDYEKSIKLLNEAKKIASDYTLDYYLESIDNQTKPFILLVNGIFEGISTTDLSEYAHLQIVRGNTEEAIEILNSFDDKTPFQEYYLGVALNSREVLESAYRNFLFNRNDYFFSRLPLDQLIMRGWIPNEKDTFTS
ncbi:hypothetical protein GLW05_14775 [Pontibacillus yanchengensis]|uniref:Tetratricopeptide repeat protein n=1 Tax=Pontibacillus yanchengensis TaxID=462910 RepID=A0A6I5A0I9_9BACI|nr:AimR family lysis-lysogeny pheromone receptor [Pontibacillus yanchengensis]MYL34856.1 hypothetical protein [Pontibacillus yanchengensis]